MRCTPFEWLPAFPFQPIVAAALAVLLAAGCGGKTGEKSPAGKTVDEKTNGEKTNGGKTAKDGGGGKDGNGKPKQADPSLSPEEQVSAAIDDGVAMLENKQTKKFLEEFFSEKLRRQMKIGYDLDGAAKEMTASEGDKHFLTILRSVKKLKPTMNADKTRATFESVESHKSPSSAVDAKAKDAKVDAKGFGDKLETVLDEALAAIKAEDFEKFVDNLFPVNELRYMETVGEKKILLDRLKRAGKLPPQNNPALVMAEDLQAMKDSEPKVNENVAEYSLPKRTVKAGETEFTLPARTVKLQKSDGSWRFFDAGGREKLTKLRGRSPKDSSWQVVLEKIDGRWQLVPGKN